MAYIIALLLFILVYVISKLVFSKVASLADIAEVLALVAGALAALFYLGAF